ncbi:MAG: GIY-YIG nuclease family protein [Bdellovibrionales bacterium]|nr:GIY-YIG nuclease family protein [Bdellovibrionales bacterium]
MKKALTRSMILTQQLEGISKKIFERYKKEVIQYIGNKPGVYALYDEKELYYVGRASDLAKRVNHHLKDRHSALWTHFSVYFTKKAQYANDIEAVIISIAQPKGNKIKPRLGKEKKLKDILRKAIKENHQEELRELGLGRKRRVDLKKKNKKRLNMKNYFEKSRPLMKSYKGKIYRAILLKSGKIKYKKKSYDNPTSVAKVIVRKHSPNTGVNGWHFWFVKDTENNWVKLSDLD